jgi:hypothetical protein
MPLPSEEGTDEKGLWAFTSKSRPEHGPESLTCAIFGKCENEEASTK